METYCMIVPGLAEAERAREILGLPPDLEWSDMKITFGLERFGEIRVTFIASGEQVVELAKLAVQQMQSSCVAAEAPDEP